MSKEEKKELDILEKLVFYGNIELSAEEIRRYWELMRKDADRVSEYM